ncbi:hypothetical protein Tco_0224118 [Tanacetum coccineum]
MTSPDMIMGFKVIVTKDDLEVLDFDSLESDIEDVPENARSKARRKLRKKVVSSGIRNNFYIGKEFPNRDVVKERIKAYSVESRRNIDFKKNDKKRIKEKGSATNYWKAVLAVEHRYCVRHMNENMNLSWEAFEWLNKISPEHWSRAYFSGRAHYDLLINNVCEVFNRQVLDAVDSPIITFLEFMREYLMKRIVIVQKVIQKYDGPLTPTVSMLFNKIKEASTKYTID